MADFVRWWPDSSCQVNFASSLATNATSVCLLLWVSLTFGPLCAKLRFQLWSRRRALQFCFGPTLLPVSIQPLFRSHFSGPALLSPMRDHRTDHSGIYPPVKMVYYCLPAKACSSSSSSSSPFYDPRSGPYNYWPLPTSRQQQQQRHHPMLAGSSGKRLSSSWGAVTPQKLLPPLLCRVWLTFSSLLTRWPRTCANIWFSNWCRWWILTAFSWAIPWVICWAKTSTGIGMSPTDSSTLAFMPSANWSIATIGSTTLTWSLMCIPTSLYWGFLWWETPTTMCIGE